MDNGPIADGAQKERRAKIRRRSMHEFIHEGFREMLAAGRGGRGDRGFGGGDRFGGGGFPSDPRGGGGRSFPFGDMFWSFLAKGPRARRGDVRAAILALLAERPYNGYQIIQELEQRSNGVWHPSPGSIYPTFQQLEDEGLVAADAGSGGSGRIYRLTEQGQAFVKEHKKELKAPWEAVSNAVAGQEIHQQLHQLRDQIGQLSIAAVQVARAGNAAHVAEAVRLLADARRALYRILAEDEQEHEDD
jgi:DNA-binding PadR family transcriptional regulator